MKKLPEHLDNTQTIAIIALEYQEGSSENFLAKKFNTTIEMIYDIVENYKMYQKIMYTRFGGGD